MIPQYRVGMIYLPRSPIEGHFPLHPFGQRVAFASRTDREKRTSRQLHVWFRQPGVSAPDSGTVLVGKQPAGVTGSISRISFSGL